MTDSAGAGNRTEPTEKSEPTVSEAPSKRNDDDSTLLKVLLKRRYLSTHRTFCKEWDSVAHRVNRSMVGSAPGARQFARWISGELRGLPYPDHCQILETMFPGYTAQQLFASYQGLFTPAQADPKKRNQDTSRVEHEATIVARTSDNISDSAVSPGRHLQDVRAILMDAADESIKFLAWAESSNVGDLTIDQLHSEIRWIAHNYLKVATVPLFERTRALRDRVVDLLDGRQKPSHSRDLYSAAGWCLTLLGWMSTDLGHPEIAERHLSAAWLCAENAEQNNLRSWVRATQHTAAYWQNDFPRAVQYAEDGLRYATTGTTELFLASALSVDLGRCGDLAGAQAALTRARNAADLMGDHGPGDELSGPLTCTVARAGGFWSDVNLAIGNAAEALSDADRAISSFEATPTGERNRGSERMVRLQRVKSHLALNEFREAADALIPVLNTEPEHRVAPLVRRMNEVAQMASAAAQKTRIAAQIRDAATEFQKVQPLKSVPQ